MSVEKDWREGEIRSIVQEELRFVLQPHYALLEKQGQILEKIADASTMQLQSFAILHGNKEFGIEGFVDESRRRISSLDDRYGAISKAIGILQEELKDLQKQRHPVRFFANSRVIVLLRDDTGKIDYKRVAAVSGAFATIANVAWRFVPRWPMVKHLFSMFRGVFR